MSDWRRSSWLDQPSAVTSMLRDPRRSRPAEANHEAAKKIQQAAGTSRSTIAEPDAEVLPPRRRRVRTVLVIPVPVVTDSGMPVADLRSAVARTGDVDRGRDVRLVLSNARVIAPTDLPLLIGALRRAGDVQLEGRNPDLLDSLQAALDAALNRGQVTDG